MIGLLRRHGPAIAAAGRQILGVKRYRSLVEHIKPELRHDEVSIVFHAIGAARSGMGIMLDVGGHHGESSELFLSQGWHVHCFEPAADNWEIIRSRVRQHRRKFRLFPVALGEVPDEGRVLYTSEESSGITSLHPFHESHQPTISVAVSTLAEHCAVEGITRIDFLKIDTEGFDLFVLRGHDWRVRPDVIVCEFEDRKTAALGYTFHDMAEYLSTLGYRVIVSEWRPIVRYGEAHEWLRWGDYPCDLESPEAWGNLIAVRDENTAAPIIARLKSVSPRPRQVMT